jgi:hypothetical protein
MEFVLVPFYSMRSGNASFPADYPTGGGEGISVQNGGC